MCLFHSWTLYVQCNFLRSKPWPHAYHMEKSRPTDRWLLLPALVSPHKGRHPTDRRCPEVVRKIHSHGRKYYWDRLKSLHLYSLERRRERYRIIYVWKMLEKVVPNLTTEENKIKSVSTLRNGRQWHLEIALDSSAIASWGSFSVHGARLFNCLPQQLRDMTDVELPEFKKKLDEFLANIPDEPQSPGYTDTRRAASNSLLDMVQTSQWVRTCWMYYIFYNGVPQYNVG